MTSNFRSHELRASTGERFGIQLRRGDGLPTYWPNLFATTQLRARSLATNTICRALSNIALLYERAHARQIDLDHVLVHGRFLSRTEAEQLADDMRWTRSALNAESSKNGRLAVRDLESVRRKPGKQMRLAVGPGEASVRIRDVVHYLEWHANRRIALMANGTEASHFRAVTGAVLSLLRALIPKDRTDDSDVGRTGLLAAERRVLLAAIQPDATNNPFRGEFQRLRNYLYIRCLYEFGCRRGESLQLKVEDINVHSRLVKIHRSADDSDDPRKLQPRTKTLARTIPISAHLADELYDYIDRVWIRLPIKQRRHGYLWTTAEGFPLALSTINDIFRRLRTVVAGLPPDLTPHTLRHDWNERFSEAIDSLPSDKRFGEEKEEQTRRHMMGWSAHSEMSRRYTRRFVREKASQVVEEMSNLAGRSTLKSS